MTQKTTITILILGGLCLGRGVGAFVRDVTDLVPPEPPSQTIGEQLSALEAKVDNLELERSALFGALQAHQEKNTLIQQDLDACQLAASRTTGTEQLP